MHYYNIVLLRLKRARHITPEKMRENGLSSPKKRILTKF